MEKVSIIVPVYNTKNYLPRCVDSLVKQDYSNTEILLVDNMSDDGSAQLCDDYSSRYTNVYGIHLDEKGVSRARNAGLEYATGKYIAFCDSDDYMPANALKDMVEAIETANAELCIGRYRELSHGCEREELDDFFVKGTISIKDAIMTVGKNANWNGGGYVWNKLFLKSVIEADSPIRFNERFDCYEDLLFVLSYMQRCQFVSRTDSAIYVYNKDNVQSISHMQINYRNVCKIIGLDAVCDKLNEFEYVRDELYSRKSQLLKLCVFFCIKLLFKKDIEKKKSLILLRKVMKKYSKNFQPDEDWDIRYKIVYKTMSLLRFI